METKRKASGEDRQKKRTEQSIPWHPAFVEALKMELAAYQEVLDFQPEYQLTAEPLRIDCIVIKKTKDTIIKKNIAAFFREVNLLEYKSPSYHRGQTFLMSVPCARTITIKYTGMLAFMPHLKRYQLTN